MAKLPDYSTFPTLSRNNARQAAAQLLDADGAGQPVGIETLFEVERFYRREARLLDAHRLDDWYALLADDLFYWMPLRENRFSRDRRKPLDPDAMALFDERKADIAVRIGRVASNLAWTEDPPTRCVSMISNVEAFQTDIADEIEVHSTFAQYRNRSERDEATLFGRRRDILRRSGDGFLIARRLILLPQSVLLTKNLSVFF